MGKAKMATEEAVAHEDSAIEGRREISTAELKSITEALIFVADEPINTKTIADVIDVDREAVEKALAELVEEYDARASGLQLREIAGAGKSRLGRSTTKMCEPI